MCETKLDYIQAIREQHGCGSRFLEAVWVTDTFHGMLAWEGAVMVYLLEDCPKASVCFVWTIPKPETGGVEYVAILAGSMITSPLAAVRAYVESRG
jgi:hypothetical protein